jgi:hypothetical protein
MPLTLNQFLFLVITLAVVVAVVFLVNLLIQLRRTAAEGERTLIEIRELAKRLRDLDSIVKERLDDLGQTLEGAKKAALSLSEVSLFQSSKFFGPSVKFVPLLIPLFRFIWRQMKKRKEK